MNESESDIVFFVLGCASVALIVSAYGYVVRGPVRRDDMTEYSELFFTKRVGRIGLRVGFILLGITGVLALLFELS